MDLKYIPLGDSAFIIKAGDVISEEVNLTVRKLLAKLERKTSRASPPGRMAYTPTSVRADDS